MFDNPSLFHYFKTSFYVIMYDVAHETSPFKQVRYTEKNDNIEITNLFIQENFYFYALFIFYICIFIRKIFIERNGALFDG